MSPHSSPASLRKIQREACLAAREAVPPARRAAWTRRIETQLEKLLEQLAPQCLGFCWPHRGEPDLTAWVGRWLAAHPGRTATIPVVTEKATPMAFRLWAPGAPMTHDRHGIPIPAGAAVARPQVLLIPVNAFDDKGYRLGYGGGYFDRTLETLAPMPIKIGVGFELSRVATTHPQPHDHPMDWIVTEAGIDGPLVHHRQT